MRWARKAGVCQDFAHIMITLVRSKLRIPCRYVSGYLFHGESDHDRSVSSATHAWVEALVPQLGWVGFDPTNWLVAGDRHIRTAIGRDYADVPPTHGIFRGRAASELTVAVRVTPSEGTPSLDQELPVPEDWSMLVEKATQLPEQPPPPTRQQQMAQQQQEVRAQSARTKGNRCRPYTAWQKKMTPEDYGGPGVVVEQNKLEDDLST